MSKKGTSGYFVQQNRGKKSVGLDIKKPGSNQIIERLLKHADVLWKTLGPGVLEKKEMGLENVKKLNDKLVMASISMYGKTVNYHIKQVMIGRLSIFFWSNAYDW